MCPNHNPTLQLKSQLLSLPAGQWEAGSNTAGGACGPGVAESVSAAAAVQGGHCGCAAQVSTAPPALEPCSRMGPGAAHRSRGMQAKRVQCEPAQ